MSNPSQIAIAVAAALVFTAAAAAYAQSAGSGPGMHHNHGAAGHGPMMRQGMGPGMGAGMGRGPVGMLTSQDANSAADLGVAMNLVHDNTKIRRTVTRLPDGIRTVTESDDPITAQDIKAHVAGMSGRLKDGREFNIFSTTLPVIFDNAKNIRSTVEFTGKGAIVTRTSTDAKVVAALQAHADEVTELVKEGPVAFHRGIDARRAMGPGGPRAIALSPVSAQAPHTHQHSFEDAGKWAKVFDDPERDAWQKPHDVIQALALKPDAIVADIGAGTGYFSMRLAHMTPNGRVYGVDTEPSMVKHLAGRAKKEGLKNITAVQAKPGDPNLPEKADLVLLVDVYHHVEDRERYFRRLQDSLTPRGRIAVIDFRMDSPVGPPKSARIEPERVKAEMQRAGYGLAQEHSFLPNQYFMVFRPAAQPGGR